MAKKTSATAGEPPPEKKTTMKVSQDLVRKAKVVTTLRGIDLYDYVDSLLRPLVERDYHKIIEEEAKDV